MGHGRPLQGLTFLLSGMESMAGFEPRSEISLCRFYKNHFGCYVENRDKCDVQRLIMRLLEETG